MSDKLFMKYFLFTLVFVIEVSVQALCVTADKANLRKGPGSKHAVTWTVGKYMPFLQLRKKGRWLEVKDVNGKKHWVHSSLVSDRISCLVVKAPYSNLRTGPGRSFSKAEMGVADKYTPFRDLGGEEGWHLVDNGMGGEGWIYASNVWKAVKIQRLNL